MSLRACSAIVAGLLFFGGSLAGATAATILSGCTDIQKSGYYTLDRDITGTVGSGCVQIRDVSDVHLDCQGHSITTDSSFAALVVQAAKNFSITGCKLPQYSGYSLFVGNSLNGTITRNVVKDMVVFETSPLAAASFRLIENRFSEFRGGSLDDSHSEGFNGLIPVPTGVTQILARNMITPASADVPGDTPTPVMAESPMHVRAFPNPWNANRHSQSPITFDGLPANSTIQIYTVSAHWVRTLNSPATTLSWDLRNNRGDPVASGIYLYTATTNAGQKTVGKLTVIR